MTYNWQQTDWPNFKYSLDEVQDALLEFAQKTGRVSGVLDGLPDNVQNEVIVDLMVTEAIKSSEIEGEFVSREDVKSSIRNNLGLNEAPEKVTDVRAEGLAQLMIDVRDSFREELTEEKLFEWHKMIFCNPTLFRQITVGAWRRHEEPMQVVSGHFNRQVVHFEAPPSKIIPKEMDRFIVWFNRTAPGKPNEIKSAPVRSAISHLYFESVHPFEDGNGRIGRAIAEKALSQGLVRPVLMSLSKTIDANKNNYYEALKEGQKSNEVSPWIKYFVQTVLVAQIDTEKQVDFILQKAKFFDKYRAKLNERQIRVIRRMLRDGPESFEGGINARKYIAIAHVSKATATRDLHYLKEIGVLNQVGAGRSVRYEVNLCRGQV